eukprot:scaffold1620_cov233-Pinguiococcus_pyrenoidosus.AAC.9
MAVGLSQAVQRARLQLAHALAGDAHHAAHLVQGARVADDPDPEAQLDDAALPGREALDQLEHGGVLELLVHRVDGLGHLFVLEGVDERAAVPLAAQRRVVEGHVVHGRLHGGLDLLGGYVEGRGQLLVAGVAIELLGQLGVGPLELVDELVHVHGQAHVAGLVVDVAHQRLADPPRGVRAELEALAGVELLRRLHEPEGALLHQVGQVHVLEAVLARDAGHQPHVRVDHRSLGMLAALHQRHQRFGVRVARDAQLVRGGRTAQLRLQLPARLVHRGHGLDLARQQHLLLAGEQLGAHQRCQRALLRAGPERRRRPRRMRRQPKALGGHKAAQPDHGRHAATQSLSTSNRVLHRLRAIVRSRARGRAAFSEVEAELQESGTAAVSQPAARVAKEDYMSNNEAARRAHWWRKGFWN